MLRTLFPISPPTHSPTLEPPQPHFFTRRTSPYILSLSPHPLHSFQARQICIGDAARLPVLAGEAKHRGYGNPQPGDVGAGGGAGTAPAPRAAAHDWLTPASRRCRLRATCGSNEPSRSRGTSISTGPMSVSTVFDRVPLREFPRLRQDRACHSPGGPTAPPPEPSPAPAWSAQSAAHPGRSAPHPPRGPSPPARPPAPVVPRQLHRGDHLGHKRSFPPGKPGVSGPLRPFRPGYSLLFWFGAV
jgi:hypothetical protein